MIHRYIAADVTASPNDQQVEQQAVNLLHDTKWRDVSDNAALFAFSNCPQTGYHSTPENDAFLRDYAGNRPLSFPLLQQAAAELNRAQTRGELQRRRNQPISVEQLDQLDDAAVQRTYEQTMKEKAQRIRAADRGEQPTDPVSALLQQKAEFENQ